MNRVLAGAEPRAGPADSIGERDGEPIYARERFAGEETSSTAHAYALSRRWLLRRSTRPCRDHDDESEANDEPR